MKKTLLIFCAVLGLVSIHNMAFAQAGGVYTVAGGGSSLADGVPATSAYMETSTGVCADPAGNVYVADDSLATIRRIDRVTGLITTIATLPSSPRDLFSDIHGNIFITENNWGSSVIRKINAATGAITIVAGGGTSLVDGIPATSYSLEPSAVYVDGEGNIYTGGNRRLYKVDASTGIITTILGNGTPTDGGDGGPANAATMSGNAISISMDAASNLYFVSNYGDRVRKINASTGIVTTVAGGGASIANGVLATNAQLGTINTCAADAAGNLFIADWANGIIRRVGATTGIINTIAGIESGGSSAEGTPALSADINPFRMWIDPGTNTVYYSTYNFNVKKFSYATIYGGCPLVTADSFSTSIYKRCNGPELTIMIPHYSSGYSIKTFFGDGTSDSSAIVPVYTMAGNAIVYHSYPATGVYSIRQFLYHGGVIEDSLITTYTYSFCRSLPIGFLY